VHPQGAGLYRFEYGGHPHGIGTHGSQHSNFGWCLVLRANQAGINTLTQVQREAPGVGTKNLA
jgi:hypothetical protein